MNNKRHVLSTILLVLLLPQFVSCQYNQQRTEQAMPFAQEAIGLGSIQAPDTWSTHTLYSAFTISVPNTMEKSSPNDNYRQQMNSIGIQQNVEAVIFQQKSLNKGSMSNADEHYCRVLVNYEKATPGDLLHSWQTEEIDAYTRNWLYENVKANLAYSQQLLSSPSYEWVDIGGAKAIRVKYRRSGNNGNTTACAMYYLFNYDEMAFVMTAYRECESNMWQTDMENVIRTFHWNQIK